MDQYLVIVSCRSSTTRQTVVQAASSGSVDARRERCVADAEELTGLGGMAAEELPAPALGIRGATPARAREALAPALSA